MFFHGLVKTFHRLKTFVVIFPPLSPLDHLGRQRVAIAVRNSSEQPRGEMISGSITLRGSIKSSLCALDRLHLMFD